MLNKCMGPKPLMSWTGSCWEIPQNCQSCERFGEVNHWVETRSIENIDWIARLDCSALLATAYGMNWCINGKGRVPHQQAWMFSVQPASGHDKRHEAPFDDVASYRTKTANSSTARRRWKAWASSSTPRRVRCLASEVTISINHAPFFQPYWHWKSRSKAIENLQTSGRPVQRAQHTGRFHNLQISLNAD